MIPMLMKLWTQEARRKQIKSLNKTAENLEKNDTKYAGVTAEVEDSTKDVNEKEVGSPYPALVNVSPSFEYTVEKK